MSLKDFFSKNINDNTAMDETDLSEINDSSDLAKPVPVKHKLPNALKLVSNKHQSNLTSDERAAAQKLAKRAISVLKNRQEAIKRNNAVIAPEISQEQIALRAWTIWQNNGCPSGQDFQNWLQAERELRDELKK